MKSEEKNRRDIWYGGARALAGYPRAAGSGAVPMNSVFEMTKTSFHFDLYPCHLGSGGVQLGFKEIAQDGAHAKHQGKRDHKHPAANNGHILTRI